VSETLAACRRDGLELDGDQIERAGAHRKYCAALGYAHEANFGDVEDSFRLPGRLHAFSRAHYERACSWADVKPLADSTIAAIDLRAVGYGSPAELRLAQDRQIEIAAERAHEETPAAVRSRLLRFPEMASFSHGLLEDGAFFCENCYCYHSPVDEPLRHLYECPEHGEHYDTEQCPGCGAASQHLGLACPYCDALVDDEDYWAPEAVLCGRCREIIHESAEHADTCECWTRDVGEWFDEHPEVGPGSDQYVVARAVAMATGIHPERILAAPPALTRQEYEWACAEASVRQRSDSEIARLVGSTPRSPKHWLALLRQQKLRQALPGRHEVSSAQAGPSRQAHAT
jgi:hypothetical protein